MRSGRALLRLAHGHIFVVMAVAMLLVLVPQQAHAAPVHDRNAANHWTRLLLAKASEAYATAKHWRTSLLQRAEQAYQHTQTVVDIRRQFERRAVGELGRWGEHVPDWQERMNACTLSADGHTACDVGRYLSLQYDRVMDNGLVRYRNEAFRHSYSVRSVVDSIIGREVGNSSRWALSMAGGPGRYIAAIEEPIDEQAEQAVVLANSAEHLNNVVDQAIAEEMYNPDGSPKPMSSGRAAQLQAAATQAEVAAALESAKESLQYLRLATIEAMNQVRDVRLESATRHRTWVP